MALARSRPENPFARATLWTILVLAVLSPTLFWPLGEGVSLIKPLVIEVIALMLFILLTAYATWSRRALAEFLRTGPNAAILLFVVWSASTCLFSPHRAYGLQQLLQLGAGVILYVIIAGRLATRTHLQMLAGGLTGAVIGSVLVACLMLSLRPDAPFAGVFGNPQLLASFLAMTLPLIVVTAQADRGGGRRLAAQFAMALSVAALVLTRNRSAWLGVAVGLAVLSFLTARPALVAGRLMRHKHQVFVPVLAILLGAVLFFITSGSGSAFLTRALTLGALSSDPSFGWRWQSWVAAVHMFLERPFTGWGLGAYSLLASKFGAPALSPAVAAGLAPSMREMVHNQYLQILAETGVIGLLLYGAVLAGFLLHCGRALRHTVSQTRRWLLMGAIAAVCTQVVDAVGNPSYQYADVSLFFWLILGLGMAAGRPRAERGAEAVTAARSGAARPVRVVRAMARLAVLAIGVSLIGAAYAEFPNTPPPGYREVTGCDITPETAFISAPRPGLPPRGQQYRFTVVFDLGNGLQQTTDLTSDPGTAWSSDSACASPRNPGEFVVASSAPDACLGSVVNITAVWSGGPRATCIDQATLQIRTARE